MKIKRYSSNKYLLPPVTIPEWKNYREDRKEIDHFALDTETTGLNWSKKDTPFGIGIATSTIKKYWDFPVDPYTREVNYGNQTDLNLFNNIYCDPSILKIGANLKFDQHMLDRIGFHLKGDIFDVIIAAWCCFNVEESYKLNDLAEKYLSHKKTKADLLKEKVKSYMKQAKYRSYLITNKVYEQYWLPKHFDHNCTLCEIYCNQDNLDALGLYNFYSDGLRQLGRYNDFLFEMEIIPVVYNMEKRGIRFFEDNCQKALIKLKKDIEFESQHIKEYFGKPKLNINSDDQIRKCLFNNQGLDLPIHEYTAGGKEGKNKKPSVSGPTLKKYYENEPIVDHLLKYRGIVKSYGNCEKRINLLAKDNYVGPMDMLDMHLNTGHKSIHCTFNQMASDEEKKKRGTRTGRFSSSNDNLQQFSDPIKSSGFYVYDERQFLGPRHDYLWYCIDYSQLELRIFAERTGGKLKEAFLAGRDPHDETRELVPYLATMEKERGRKLAKNTNFSIINYGGPGVLYEKYNVPLEEAEIIVNEFKNIAYPETKKRQWAAQKFAEKHGYITTLFNRQIDVDADFVYRATAYDIQGSAADIIKRAMLQIYEYIKFIKLDTYLLATMHDELILEINKRKCFKWFLREIKSIMKHVADDVMEIPLEVEFKKTKQTWSSSDMLEVNL